MSIILNKNQRGYSLMELFVGLGLMIFLMSSALIFYYVLIKSYSDVVAVNRMDQQLRAAITMMVQDIRRAGYSGNAIADLNSNQNTNPFMAAGVDINVPISTCILFAYDSDSSGTLPALDSTNYDKRFGYRLFDNTLQTRALTDSSFSCTAGNWVDLTDSSQVQVTNLTFTLTPNVITLANGVSTITIRDVDISLTANLLNDPSVSRTITESVRVRNDKFQP